MRPLLCQRGISWPYRCSEPHVSSATECCDGADQDCDGQIDEGAVDAVTVFEDLDGDTYGNSYRSILTCDSHGYATEGGGCDDTDPASYPGAQDILDDGIDQDCDGTDLTSGDKNSSTCSVIAGVFSMGAVWLGPVGVLRRREASRRSERRLTPPLRLCGDITLAEDLADFLLPMLSPLIRMCLARDRMRGS